jgi:S-adenosylmethionine hydrolase
VPTISVMTDFGIKDGNVGVMKGVVWGICPEAHIADISHMVAPQNVAEAALILARSAPYFPAGTIHLVVVDPGVGTARRPLAACIGASYFVGPDNGVITLWLERALAEGATAEFVKLDRDAYWLRDVSHVFHGRDIFAPAAAHLAAGVPLRMLGSPIDDPVLLRLPKPQRHAHRVEGQVIHIDHFGNVASNILIADLGDAREHMDLVEVQLGAMHVVGFVKTFGERPAGETIALVGSTGNVIVSIVNGNAAANWGVRVGDPFNVLLPGRAPVSDNQGTP